MYTKKTKKRSEIIAEDMTEKTHQIVCIKMPMETIAKLKKIATSKGRLFSSFVIELVERGAEL